MAKLARNKATDIRKELLVEVLKCVFEGRLRDLDSLPQRLYPRDKVSYRCCIHKDRYIVRGRIIAVLGHDFKDGDDARLLQDYAADALSRDKVAEPVLTVIDEACSSCVKVNYYVTDACRGCVARPCTVNCPQKAISVVQHKANIDADKCVGCGVCQKVCPYNAIIYVPVPCEEGCPVGAIHKGANGKETIDYGKCIYCGMCTRACPFGAIVEKTQVVDVARRLMEGGEAVAMVAPSIVGQYPGTLNQIVASLRKLGFTRVVEVAYGADVTAREEAQEFAERMRRGDAMMGTSCCPAYLEAVRKHATDFGRYVSHARTPMSYAAEYAAKAYPGAVKVFIGPCITKKFEGMHDPNVDYVLTYEELEAFFKAKGIKTDSSEEGEFDNAAATRYGRGFAVSGGVGAALEHNAEGVEVKKVVIDGLDKAGVQTLREYGRGAAPGNLVEVMCCRGGCVNGPGVVADPRVAAARLKRLTEAMK